MYVFMLCLSRVPAGCMVAIASQVHGSNANEGSTRRAKLVPHSRGIVANTCCRERERERVREREREGETDRQTDRQTGREGERESAREREREGERA